MVQNSFSRNILAAAAVAALASPALAAAPLDMFYTFDGADTQTGSPGIIDTHTADGSQNGQLYNVYGGAPTLVSSGGFNNSPAVYFGTPWSGSSGSPHQDLYSVIFDIGNPNGIVYSNNAISYSLWINPVYNNGVTWLLHNGNPNSLMLLLNANGTLRLGIDNPRTAFVSPFAVPFGTTTGHHVGFVATYNGTATTVTWYEDGAQVGSPVTGASSWPDASGVYGATDYNDQAGIGGIDSNDGTVQYLGMMDDLFLSTSAATAAQMAAVQGVVAAPTWNVDADGNWTTPANWLGSVPNAAGASALFGSTITAPRTVTLDAPQTVGQITFDNANSYTIAGTNTLTIDNSGVAGTITVNSGSHTINVPLSLAAGLTVSTVTATSGLTLGGSVTGSGTLTAGGLGTLTISPTGSIGVPLQANGKVVFAAQSTGGFLTQTVPSIGIGSSGLVTVADMGNANHANRTLLVAGSLSITTGGALDLGGNDMVIHNSTVAAVYPLLQSGFNAGSGYWNGNGIRSSSAANEPTMLTTLGVMQGTAGGTFDSIVGTVAATDVLIKYTYYGDADLSGAVDGNDYTLIDAGYNADVSSPGGATGWQNGDFNYDGNVDGSDYSLIDNAFNLQGSGTLGSSPLGIVASQTSELAASAVPEPGTLSLLAIGAVAMMGRRRRK